MPSFSAIYHRILSGRQQQPPPTPEQQLLRVWAAPSVTEVSVSGSRVFSVYADSTVALVPSSDWQPRESETCDEWSSMAADEGLADNCYECEYDDEVAAAMLDRFNAEHEQVLREVFDVRRCEISPRDEGRRIYVTRSERGLPPDDLHADVSQSECHAEREYRSLTVLAYSHASWRAEWAGHTEFAAGDCANPSRLTAERGRAMPAVLRVAPLPNQTVVFPGRLLHRATPPNFRAGRRRYSVVMQLACR